MIINRYISKAFFKYFILILTIIISLFTIIQYLARTGNFVKLGMSFMDGLEYVLLNVPYISTLAIPLVSILSPIIVFSLIRRNHELVAMQSGGMSAYTLLRPIFYCGILVGAFIFITSELVVPKTITKAYETLRKMRNKSVTTTKDNNIWIKQDNTIVFIKYYNDKDKSLVGVTLYTLGSGFVMEKRSDARAAVFKDDHWVLKNVLEMRLNPKTGDYDSMFYPERDEKFDIKPSDLKQVVKYSEEMNIRELYRYVKRVESEGYTASNYKVDMIARTALPFTCMFLAFLGTGLVLVRQKRDALPTNITIGIFSAFLFWVSNSFCMTLGYAGRLPTLLSAWVANLILICICGILFTKVE
jgi:lipopolysaccharide export system permease protein